MTINVGNSILRNFGRAAPNYNQEAKLQRAFAWRLAKECTKRSIPKGVWVDLGAGTGLLAEALETLNPDQSVFRVDGSEAMLAEQQSDSTTQLYDLNFGLPSWPSKPTLIASSFAVHWLNNPTRIVEEWFTALAPGGWLAIALPVEGSFQEWHLAATMSGVPCTAIQLPSQKSLLKAFNSNNIHYQKLHSFTEKASGIRSLLKPIIKIGAQTSSKDRLSVGDWRKLYRAWPSTTNNGTVRLTWLIQLLMVQR